MSPSVEYLSYLIRLWREGETTSDAPAAEWQGEVEHIQSGEKWSFASLSEVLAFLKSHPGDGCDPKTIVEQNTK